MNMDAMSRLRLHDFPCALHVAPGRAVIPDRQTQDKSSIKHGMGKENFARCIYPFE